MNEAIKPNEGHSISDNSGYCSIVGNIEYCSTAVNSEACSIAVNSGCCSAAVNTGNLSVAVNVGDCSTAIAEGIESIAIASGYESKAKACAGSWIVLAEWEEARDGYHIVHVKTALAGRDVKADTFYTLVGGVFTEVEEEGGSE